MAPQYRIVFETYDPERDNIAITRKEIFNGTVEKATSIFNLGLTHTQQIQLLHNSQDLLLNEQICVNESEVKYCPHCQETRLIKYGKRRSYYHDVLTDHSLIMGRKRCPKCRYEPGSTIKNILGSSMSADLIKLQSELGSNYTYRESEEILSSFSLNKRSINNHDRIKGTVEQVGTAVQQIHDTEREVIGIAPASDLIINIDGGHINTIGDDKRSFEAMTAVIYRPEALVSNEEGTRNVLTHKQCAASALNDEQESMITNTIIAALKEGMSSQTKMTALCDGADNCWKIVDSLKPFVANMTHILDWFHLSMKIQNISLPEQLKDRLTMVKWHLWRGKTDNALIRLTTLIDEAPQTSRSRLEKLKTYITKNVSKIVDYRARKKQGLVFTSNLDESTVESLINQRCKGQQHMRWSREGLNPLLQLRAVISSNDWNNIWKTAVQNATQS